MYRGVAVQALQAVTSAGAGASTQAVIIEELRTVQTECDNQSVLEALREVGCCCVRQFSSRNGVCVTLSRCCGVFCWSLQAVSNNRVTGTLGDVDVSAVDLTKLSSALRAAAELPAPSQQVRASVWVAKQVADMRQCVRARDWDAVRRSVTAFQEVAAAKVAHTRSGGRSEAQGYPQFSPEFCTYAWWLVAQ